MCICPYAAVQNRLAHSFFFTTALKAARKGSLLFQSVYFVYLWWILHVFWSGPQVWKVWCHLCLDFSLVCWLLGDMSGVPQKTAQLDFIFGGGSTFVSEINMLLARAESCCMFALEKLFGSCQIVFFCIILRNVAWSKSAFSQMKLFQMSTVVWNNRCIDVIWSLWLRTSCQVITIIQKDACLDVRLHFKGDLMWRCEPN